MYDFAASNLNHETYFSELTRLIILQTQQKIYINPQSMYV